MKRYGIILVSLLFVTTGCSTFKNQDSKAASVNCGHYTGVGSLYIDSVENNIVGIFETSSSSNYKMDDYDYCRLLLIRSAKVENGDYIFNVLNISKRDSLYLGGTASIDFLQDSVIVKFDENLDKGNLLPCFTQLPINEPVVLYLDSSR